MTETSAGALSPAASSARASASAATTPEAPAGSRVTGHPRRPSSFTAFSTASCSIAVVMSAGRAPSFCDSAMPRTARLSASVPPEVKTISEGSPPMSLATAERASSSTAFARWPKAWMLDALPGHSRSAVETASATSAGTGAVAL